MLGRLGLCCALFASCATTVHAEQYLVRNQADYAAALKRVAAGDGIVLANGEWRDFDMVITGKGNAAKPITVSAQEAGKVILTGQSSLRIGGEYIVVSGLVFKDGYSPLGDVIAFRTDKDNLARNSRVTEVVIDNYSKPDRFESDYWVSLYGRGNRFDHNYLVGKTNQGVTVAVRLDSEDSRENKHQIDHNYFGPRPVLGSNGGETLRIGTSHYSMFDSSTAVENNVFDRCDGEVEIISVKSGSNIIRGNLFLRSRGTLTLRHGDGNLVESNVFMGHGKDYTGGIRVINRNQTIRGNYMEGLRGTGFSSALTVMNGVPNSPVNRYVQVDNALIEHNTVVDSTRITLAGGADAERSAPPVNSVMRGNLFARTESAPLFEIQDDVSGIATTNNVMLGAGEADLSLPLGRSNSALVRAANGLLYPADPALADVGAPRDLTPVSLDQTGPTWYAKPGSDARFGASGKVISVAPGEDTLTAAVASAHEGDSLMLKPGEYVVNRTIALTSALSIRGAKGTTIRFTRPNLFELGEGGDLQLIDLVVDGNLAPDDVGNAVIRTTAFPIRENMQVEMTGVTVRNLSVNKSFNVLQMGKSTIAYRVSIARSTFEDISGAVVMAAAETDDYGRYNVEYLTMSDNTFSKVGGPIAQVYRGGTDESTFGPLVSITGNTLKDVGKAATNGSGAAVLLHGVQTATVSRNKLTASAPLKIVHTVGKPETTVTGNRFVGTPAPIIEELNFEGEPRGDFSANTVDGKVLP